MKVKILGTEYEIIMNAEEKDYPILKDADGYADFTIKKIVIKKLVQDGESYEDLELWQRKTLRHEIVHAFLYESGLWQNSFKDWARNEEMTDWIALQFTKVLEVFIQVGAIEIVFPIKERLSNCPVNNPVNYPKVKEAKAFVEDNTEIVNEISKAINDIPLNINVDINKFSTGGIIGGDG